MSTDRIGEPWSGSTYNGFSGPSAPTPHREPQGSAPPAVSRKLLIGGVAGAVALGLVFGLWARPNFGEDGKAREPMRPVPQSQAALPIEVTAPVMPPVPKSTGRMEVLPQDMARGAALPPVTVVPSSRVIAVEPVPAPPPQERVVAPSPVAVSPQPRDASARVAGAEPSFDCRYARSNAEQMVCGDPRLAAADRRLDRAFNRAVAAGVPARELRAEQDDWMQIREDAARRSPRAVASIYEQRIQELNELADGSY
jgi:uncharacterized protein YecT (DUF1311 family)